MAVIPPVAVFPVHTLLLDVPGRTKEALHKHLGKPIYWRLLGTAYRLSPSTFGRIRRHNSVTTSYLISVYLVLGQFTLPVQQNQERPTSLSNFKFEYTRMFILLDSSPSLSSVH